MLSCLIMGDSIAVGTKMFAPTECVSYAHGGWNSWQWNKHFKTTQLDANTVIISLGTNDWSGIKTERELMDIRGRIHATNVIWVLPHGNLYPKGGRTIQETDAIVRKVAGHFRDHIVVPSHISPDHIHPGWKGYQQIVRESGLEPRKTPIINDRNAHSS